MMTYSKDTRYCTQVIEPPCTERYARWCERSATQPMGSLLLDLPTGNEQIVSADMVVSPHAEVTAAASDGGVSQTDLT